MRTISLNYRRSQDSQATSEIEVVLLHIEHPDLLDPVKLSTDPTERLSVDPLQYGTRSTWKQANEQDDEPFKFVLVSATLPDDKEDTPAAAMITLYSVDNTMTELFRSTINRATVSMAVVLASAPDLIEAEWGGMQLVSAEGNMLQVSMQITRQPIHSEPWPSGRMTRHRFPGLIR